MTIFNSYVNITRGYQFVDHFPRVSPWVFHILCQFTVVSDEEAAQRREIEQHAGIRAPRPFAAGDGIEATLAVF